MTGIRKRGIVLQKRDWHLLAELARMRLIDRELAKIVAGFHSTSRANTRLLKLTRAGLLTRFFVGSIAAGRKAIYTLSRKGAELAEAPFDGIRRGKDRLIVGDRFVAHQMAINEVYAGFRYRPIPFPNVNVRRWITFRERLSTSINLAPDGYVELQAGEAIRPMFLEVDLGTEALRVFEQKAACYLRLAVSGEFPQKFHQQQFRVLVIANTERRLQHLRAGVAKHTDKIFWFASLEAINRESLWSPVWLRPSGDQRLPLI
jgi:protein involved in plasmid replication-relaxation